MKVNQIYFTLQIIFTSLRNWLYMLQWAQIMLWISRISTIFTFAFLTFQNMNDSRKVEKKLENSKFNFNLKKQLTNCLHSKGFQTLIFKLTYNCLHIKELKYPSNQFKINRRFIRTGRLVFFSPQEFSFCWWCHIYNCVLGPSLLWWLQLYLLWALSAVANDLLFFFGMSQKGSC